MEGGRGGQPTAAAACGGAGAGARAALVAHGNGDVGASQLPPEHRSSPPPSASSWQPPPLQGAGEERGRLCGGSGRVEAEREGARGCG